MTFSDIVIEFPSGNCFEAEIEVEMLDQSFDHEHGTYHDFVPWFKSIRVRGHELLPSVDRLSFDKEKLLTLFLEDESPNI